MLGTIKMFCIRMNILSYRNNIVLFLACNMATMQNLYSRPLFRYNSNSCDYVSDSYSSEVVFQTCNLLINA